MLNQDDAKLLIGVYEHGVGSWEALKMDSNLGLSEKILPDEESKKPQAKHIQTRLDYLLKVMKKEVSNVARKWSCLNVFEKLPHYI